MRSMLVGAGAVVLAACGGNPPAKSGAGAAAAPSAAAAVAHSENKVMLPPGVNPDAELFIYLRGPEMRDSALYRAALSAASLVPNAGAGLDKLRSQCGFDPLEKLTYFALSGPIPSQDSSGTIGVLQVDVAPEQLATCVDAFSREAGFRSLTVAGHPTYANGRTTVAVEGRRLWLGNVAALNDAFGAQGAQSAVLPKPVFLKISVVPPGVPDLNHIDVTLATIEGAMVVTARGTADTEAAAARLLERLEQELRGALAAFAQRPDDMIMSQGKQIFERLKLTREGKQINAELRMPGAEATVAATGMLTALSLFGVRKYMQNAKTAEARATIAEIAESLVTHVTDKDLKRFGKSAPRTPAQVPSGQAVLVPAQAWQAPPWRDIGFSLADKQYYSYEYEVAPDGKSVVVRAIGDLDGDGVQSRFELEIGFDAEGVPYMKPEIVEQNPEE